MSSTLRRSTRESKKPEVFNPSVYDNTASAKSGGSRGTNEARALKASAEMIEDSDDDDDDNDDVSGEESDTEDSEGEDRVVFAHKLPRGLTKGVPKNVPKSAPKKAYDKGSEITHGKNSFPSRGGGMGGPSAAVVRAEFNTSSEMFNAVQSDSSNVDFISITNDWIRRFHKDRVAAMCELINFVLFMAGARNEVIDSDVDLDALEADELLELLSTFIKTLSDEENASFPLNEIFKKGRNSISMRQRYSVFWMDFGNRLISQSRTHNTKLQRGSDLEILHIVIDQLVAFSSLTVSMIRDAVAEAVLTLCTVLVSYQKEIHDLITNLKKQAGISNSQDSFGSLTSDVKKSSKSSSNAASARASTGKESSKLSMVQTQLDSFETLMEEIQEILETSFQSVFLHRYVDTNVTIRKVCLSKLADWICFDPQFYFKNEYLKYFGNQLHDTAPIVRIESIKCISRFATSLSKYSNLLSDFVERFSERFIEIAVGDVDSNVQLEMILLLKVLQQSGMLDIWSEESLDRVDKVVFDEKATARVRREALSFFMDHTQGFEPIDESIEDSVKAKGGKSSSTTKLIPISQSKNESKSTAMRKKKNALQIETLLEFAESHIHSDDMAKIILLANACMDIPNFELLYDWQTQLSLLLKDTDDIITTALRPFQVSMLLILFRRGVQSIRDKVDKSESMSLEKKGSKVSVDTLRQWELLNSLLSRDIHKLLTRFRDSVSNLSEILDILKTIEIPSNVTQFRLILKSLEDLYSICCNEILMNKMAEIISIWNAKSRYPGSDISNTLSKIIESSLRNVSVLMELLESDRIDGESKDVSASAKPSKVARKLSSKDNLYNDDVIMSCASSFSRLRCVWARINCSVYLPENYKSFDKIVPQVISRLIGKLSIDESSETKLSSILSILLDSSNIYFLMLLFELSTLKRMCQTSEELNSEIEIQTKKCLEYREQYLLCASRLMEVERDFSIKCQIIFRGIMRDIFHKFCQVQQLFSPLPHFQLVIDMDEFIYRPSKNMLVKVKSVFDREVRLLQNEIEESQPDTEKVEIAAEKLVNKLLDPLFRSMLINQTNEGINKKQAASILIHISTNSETVNVFMKNCLRTLKDAGPISNLLEIHLSTCKLFYYEYILPLLTILSDHEEIDQSDEEIRAILEELDAEFNNMRSVVKKLSNSLGIGKLKDEALIALTDFFDKTVEYALKDKNNLAFLDVLPDYTRFLPATSLNLQKQTIMRALSEGSALDWTNELIEQFNTGLLGALKGFCQLVIPEFDSELMTLDLRYGGSSAQMKKSKQEKAKKRKRSSESHSLSNHASNPVPSSPFFSRTAPPLNIAKGKAAQEDSFSINQTRNSSNSIKYGSNRGNGEINFSSIEERNTKGRFESNFDFQAETKAAPKSSPGFKNHKSKFEQFHLGLELEDIDESSISDNAEYEKSSSAIDYNSDDSHVINDLDEDEDFDADVSELYRSIPSRNRASAVKN